MKTTKKAEQSEKFINMMEELVTLRHQVLVKTYKDLLKPEKTSMAFEVFMFFLGLVVGIALFNLN